MNFLQKPYVSVLVAITLLGCMQTIAMSFEPLPKSAAKQGDAAEFVEFPRFSESSYVNRYDLDSDQGRKQVTSESADENQFKVPTLRNITLTAPYMHNGKVQSLTEACRVMASTQLDVELTDEEVPELIAFLSTLEGSFPEISLPRLPSRSGESVLDPALVTDN